MFDNARLIFGLVSLVLLQPAWGGDNASRSHSECIEEPIFEGKVCTLQARRDAKVGVILIHGLGGSVDDWQKTIPALAENFHVVAFDLPGFGKSDKGNQNYSPGRYAPLVRFLADHYFQDKPYHVVGHSMGGAIALRFAGQRPTRMQRLVLIDPAGILHPQVITKFQVGSMMERASGLSETRGFAERLSGKILEQVDRLPFLPADIANTEFGRSQLLQGGPDKIAALSLSGEDFSYAISSVTTATLVIWGDHDLVVPLRTGQVLAARMPRARLEIISGSGHEPMLDQADQVNNLVKKHLLDNDKAMSELYEQVPPLPASASDRMGVCSGKSGVIFEGAYRSIKLTDCSNITIRNARVGKLTVLNSIMTMIDTDIQGKDVGLQAENSDITITNGNISGVIAINATGSRFDIAGARLKGTLAAVKGVDSKLVFSVCQVSSPHTTGNLHTFKNMIDEEL